MEQIDLWEFVPSIWQTELAVVHEQIDAISYSLRNSAGFLPVAENIFRALVVPPKDVRVLIVGQDPYPNPEYACGLSFSVPSGTQSIPGSLRNIISEVRTDMGTCLVEDGDLEAWLSQGVMLLNRTLTVEAHSSDSHKHLGWEIVTDQIVTAIVAANPNVVAVLWGKQAQSLAKLFDSGRVIAGVHPSPLSAYRGFFGSRPFSRVNELLGAAGKSPIHW